MNPSIRLPALSCLVMFALACGSTGSDTPSAGGGTVGSGGSATGSGGSTTSSGGSTTGTGGTTGAGGSPEASGPMLIKSYTFDADQEDWKYIYVSNGAGVPPVDATQVKVTWNGDDGQPTKGCLQVEIPFTMASQYVGIGIQLPGPPLPGVDLRGRTISAFVKIKSGLENPTDLMSQPGGASLYAKSVPGYVYAATRSNLTMGGTWIPIAFDPMQPSYKDTANDAGTFDPSNIYEVGIQLETGGAATTAQSAVILIDTVSY